MILVCGEALIDLFLVSTDSGPVLEVAMGGSPFNLALGLARLETPAGFFGGVSNDYFGVMLIEALANEGVDTSLVKRSVRPTPLVLVSPDSQGNPSYTFYAHEAAAEGIELADVSQPLPPSVDAIALGSYLLAVEPAGTALLALAEREAHRRVIAIDCNLRPAMVGPIHAWRQHIERFARCASIIKLSDEDFAGGWSDGASPDDQAASWLKHGVRLVLMTHGPRGATAWHSSGRVTAPALPVEVVDSVGAGDSFQAALLARLAQNGLLNPRALSTLDGSSIADAMRYANLAAGMTCRRRGANLPRRAEIEQCLSRGEGT
jgi:fructokinase